MTVMGRPHGHDSRQHTHFLVTSIMRTTGYKPELGDTSSPRMVPGSILGTGTILSWRLVMESFLRPFFP